MVGSEIGYKLEKGDTFEEKNSVANASVPFITPEMFEAMAAPSSLATISRPSISPRKSALNREAISPISVISPYFSAWIIRARVTSKGDIKTYNNKKGPGKLFNFNVIDESGEIRITAFNSEVTRFYDLIEEGKVYYISKGVTKAANKQFNTLKSDYEITLEKGSIIEPCLDADVNASMPKICFTFLPIADLTNKEEKSAVDIIGVIRSVAQVEILHSKKTNKELTKRDITLVDRSLAEARFTLWSEKAIHFAGTVGEILAIKSAMVGEFNGKTLSTSANSTIQLNPDIPEAPLLKNWYMNQGVTETFTCLSRPAESPGAKDDCAIGQINESVVNPNTPTYFTINGTVTRLNKAMNQMYKSCGFNDCQKKVEDSENGIYKCSKCGHEGPGFTWRLLLSLMLVDATGSIWVTVFQEMAEKLIGHKVEELALLNETDPDKVGRVIKGLCYKMYTARIGVRLEEYNKEKRLRSTAYKLIQPKPVARAQQLMAKIAILAQV